MGLYGHKTGSSLSPCSKTNESFLGNTFLGWCADSYKYKHINYKAIQLHTYIAIDKAINWQISTPFIG